MNMSSDDSDNEGFVADRIKIHQQKKIKVQQKQAAIFTEFEPHYIAGEGLIRKEPPQAIAPYLNIPSKMSTFLPRTVLSSQEGQHLTASELFMNKKNYYLVYKRFRDAFGIGEKAAFQHLVRLNCCQNTNEDNFKLLKEWTPQCLQQVPFSQNCLIFDSHFEGGNLLCAFKQKHQLHTYVLFMQNDTNTYGYNQWFYFSIRNMTPNVKYTFKIVNYRKPYSFFKEGQQILAFSLFKAKANGNGWYRDGASICYYPSVFRQKNCSKYYTLQFNLQFEHQNDYVTLSPYAPYSYSKLISSLRVFEKTAHNNNLCWKLKSIATSISNNQVPYVILSKKKTSKTHKKKILIFARQHSGETWSSFLVQNILEQLVEQKTDYSKWLMESFDFHVFPMINVDGVIYGNFRCDLAGYDLNRAWKSPLQLVHPQIFHIKKELTKLSEKYQIQMCLDLHTHSKQYGAFAYCCVDSPQCRQLPQLISTYSPFFRSKACTFGISGDKKYTARAAVFSLAHSLLTITVELSSCGFKLHSRKYSVSFTPNHIKNISKGILKGFYSYKQKLHPEAQQDVIQIEDGESVQSVCLQQFLKDIRLHSEKDEHPVDGSDSEPQIDQISQQVRMKTIFPLQFIEDIDTTKQGKHSKSKISRIKKNNKSVNRSKIFTKFQLRKNVQEVERQPFTIDKSATLGEPEIVVHQIEVSPPKINNNKLNFHSQYSQYKKYSNLNYEKSHKTPLQKPTKPVNFVQFSLKKLPITAPQKIGQNYHIFLDEGAPLFSAQSYGKKQENRFDKTFSTYEAMCRPRARAHSKKIGVMKEESRLQQQLPFLCIMSETKKQLQLERMKEKQQTRSMTRKGEIKRPEFQVSGHKKIPESTMVKFQGKQKHLQLMAKIGSDNYTRYPYPQGFFLHRV